MGTDERAPSDRLADHAAIDALANELIPALIAKLGASGLGEIEVREGDWKVRLRRPADGVAPTGGRRSGRSGAGSTDPAGADSRRPGARPGRARRGRQPGDRRHDRARVRVHRRRRGIGPQPRPVPGDRDLAGRRVLPATDRDRARLRGSGPATRSAAIDVLGRPDRGRGSPADGIVGASLVEPGEAVEYGQELVWVELLSSSSAGGDDGAGRHRAIPER